MECVTLLGGALLRWYRPGTEGQDQKCCVPCEDLLTPRFSFAGWIQEWARGRNATGDLARNHQLSVIGESNQRDVRVRGLRDGSLHEFLFETRRSNRSTAALREAENVVPEGGNWLQLLLS